MNSFLLECLAVMLAGSTIILASAFFVTWCWRNGSAAQRCSVWQISYLGVLVLPMLVCLLPTVGLGWFASDAEPTVTIASQERLAALVNSNPPRNVESDNSSELVDHDPNQAAGRTDSLFQTSKTGAATIAPTVPTVNVDSNSQKNHPSHGWQFSHIVPLVVLVWVFGALYSLGRFLNANRIASGIRRRATPIISTAGSLPRVVGDFSQPIPVMISNEVSTPSTIGVIAACVVLPSSSVDWDPKRIRMVLKHEFAHVARCDVAWQWVSAIVGTTCWFQPLAWIAERRMHLERECACDDRVIQNEPACDYALALVAVAAEWSKQDWQLAGALSMAQKPIEKRLQAILEPHRKRNSSGWGLNVTLVVFFVLLAATISTIRPLDQTVAFAVNDSRIQGKDDSKTVEWITISKPISGKIVDQKGKPIPGATAEITILPYTQWNIEGQDVKHKLPIATCDESGEYSIDISNFQVPKAGFKVTGNFSARNHPSSGFNFSVRSTDKLDEGLEVIKLLDGRIIEGKILAPVVDGKRLSSPQSAYIVAARGAPNFWFSDHVAVETDGSFEIVIPRVGLSELIVGASNYSGIRIPVTPTENDGPIDLGELELQTGTTVSGVVNDIAGNPVSGAIIHIEQTEESNSSALDGVSFELSGNVKTEADGRFQLPPQRGKCRINVARSGKNYEGAGYLKADNFPIVPALNIDLPTHGEKEVTLQAVPTITIRGTIRWLDGSPAPGINMRSYGASTAYSSVNTDDHGNYELVYPQGDFEVHVSSTGTHDNQRRLFWPHPVEKIVAKQKYMGSIIFEHARTNIDGADWVLRPDEVVERRTHTESDQALKAINQKLNRDIDQFKQDTKGKLGPVVNSNYMFTHQDSPFAKYVGILLEFEEDNRGEFAALIALRHLLKWNNDGLPAANAKYKEVISILEQHYANHKDLDLLVDWLIPPDDLTLWIRAVEPNRSTRKLAALVRKQNTDDRVQASMLHRFISTQTDVLELVQSLPAAIEKRPELMQRFDPALVEAIRNVDRGDVLESIKEKQSVLATQYPHAILSRFADYPSSDGYELCLDRPLGNINEIQTYSNLANGLIFDIESLQPGQPWPELKGDSGLGEPYDLAAENGKVVVVYFAAQWANNSFAGLNQSMRDLKKKYQGQPFEIVTIMVDKKRSAVKKMIDEGEITWSTIHDGAKGPIATRWNVGGLDRTLYLLDHTGKFRQRIGQREEFEEIIAAMVEAAKNAGG